MVPGDATNRSRSVESLPSSRLCVANAKELRYLHLHCLRLCCSITGFDYDGDPLIFSTSVPAFLLQTHYV